MIRVCSQVVVDRFTALGTFWSIGFALTRYFTPTLQNWDELFQPPKKQRIWLCSPYSTKGVTENGGQNLLGTRFAVVCDSERLGLTWSWCWRVPICIHVALESAAAAPPLAHRWLPACPGVSWVPWELAVSLRTAFRPAPHPCVSGAPRSLFLSA